MGSEKSGRRLGAIKKTSVLECLRLTVSDMRGAGIVQGNSNEAIFSWKTGPADEDVATVRAKVMSRSATRVDVCLAYMVYTDGVPDEISETIHLVKASQDCGRKWWFRCPAEVDGQTCGRQVGVLYLPPAQQYFGCITCHDLAYAWSKGNKEDEGIDVDEKNEMQSVDGEQEGLNDVGRVGDDSARPASGEALADGPDMEPNECQLRLRSFYIDHAMKLLDPENTALPENGRRRVVDELLSNMAQDDSLSDDRFLQVIPEVQSRCPEAFGALATRMLREGHLSTGPEHAYFMLRRLGHIIRLHLVCDLQLERAADLLLLDAAIEAFIQARILLDRATPLSPENGPLPGEEKYLRSQAVTQQKLFLSMLDKLMPKPVRRLGRPPKKQSA